MKLGVPHIDCFNRTLNIIDLDIISDLERLCKHNAEAARNISYLKKGGLVIVNKKVIQPTTASLTGSSFNINTMIEYLEKTSGQLITVDTDQACQDLGSTKVVNMVLLGAACKTGLISKDNLKTAIKLLVKPAFYELNIKAVDYVS